MSAQKLGIPNGSGAAKAALNPYYDLIAAVYTQAVDEVKKYDPCTRFFESAANFLLKDPYGILDNHMREEIEEMIWKRRDEARAKKERGITDIDSK